MIKSHNAYRRLPGAKAPGRYGLVPFDSFSVPGNFECIMNESKTNFELYIIFIVPMEVPAKTAKNCIVLNQAAAAML